jgi:hypothetical protein
LRLLIVTNHYLDNRSGGSLASIAFINAFSFYFENATCIFPFRGKESLSLLDRKVYLIPVNYNRPKFYKLLNRIGENIHFFQKSFNKEIENTNYDLILFDHSSASLNLIDKINIPSITIHHNFESEYLKISKGLNNWLKKRLVLKAEKKAVQLSKVNLTLTDSDLNKFVNDYGAVEEKFFNLGCFNVKDEIENFLIDSRSNVYLKPIDSLIFVISGSLDSLQNIFSIDNFLTSIWSDFTVKFPNCKLLIAGKNPNNLLKKSCLRFSNIQIIDSPEDMDEIILSSDIYICPIDIGGGFKLRIMDGLKNGRIILANKNATRGYEKFVDQGYVLVFHDLMSFTESINQVIIKEIKPTEIKTKYFQEFSFFSGKERVRLILESLQINKSK